MSGHTPGPWSVVRRRDGFAIQPVGAVLLGSPNEADLALLASAPEQQAKIDALAARVAALEKLISVGIQAMRNEAATLVKWAVAFGGHTPSAIIAGHLRELADSIEKQSENGDV